MFFLNLKKYRNNDSVKHTNSWHGKLPQLTGANCSEHRQAIAKEVLNDLSENCVNKNKNGAMVSRAVFILKALSLSVKLFTQFPI